MRVLVMLLIGLLFIACGGKKIEVSEGSSSQAIQEEKPQQNQVDNLNKDNVDEFSTLNDFVPKPAVMKAQFDPVYFAYDSFILSRQMFKIVDKNAEILKEYPKSKIILQGNTDAYGSDEYNFALGTKRALAVKDALIVRGIHKDQISTVSFGETNPVCTSLDAECRQRNRRVDFVIENK